MIIDEVYLNFDGESSVQIKCRGHYFLGSEEFVSKVFLMKDGCLKSADQTDKNKIETVIQVKSVDSN